MSAALPLVSIVTPSYNQGRFLEETLLSVQRQDYPRVEHVVVDGGSSDGSIEIIRRHEGHLARWVSEPDGGQSDALRKGFSMATGEILFWLNSDDLIVPSAVSIAVRALAEDPAVGLVYGDRVEIDARGNILNFVRLPSHDPDMFRRNFTIPQETAFFRRGAFEAAGGIDAGLHFAMDFDLWCRMAKICRMRHLPAFLGSYRVHGASKSVEYHGAADPGAAKFAAESAEIYRRHFGRKLPSPRRMRMYRALRRLRVLRELVSGDRRRDLERIRAGTEGGA